MIFYGWNTLQTSSQRPPDIHCFNCNEVGEMFVKRYVKSWHIFWIPMFPYGLIHEFSCVRCNSVLQYDEMSPDLKQVYKKYKVIRIPVWKFAGSIIILSLIIGSWVSNYLKKDKMKQLVNGNVIDLICDYKLDKKNYSSFKICSSNADFVSVVYNKLQTNKILEMEDLTDPKYFTEDTIIMKRSELIKMIDDDIIEDIHL